MGWGTLGEGKIDTQENIRDMPALPAVQGDHLVKEALTEKDKQ